MSDSETYSIKEMITEFRHDMNEKFSNVKERLEGIENKSAYANGRTSKLEMWQKLIIGGAIATWTITILVGGYMFSLVKTDIINEAVKQSLTEVNLHYNLRSLPPEK